MEQAERPDRIIREFPGDSVQFGSRASSPVHPAGQREDRRTGEQTGDMREDVEYALVGAPADNMDTVSLAENKINLVTEAVGYGLAVCFDKEVLVVNRFFRRGRHFAGNEQSAAEVEHFAGADKPAAEIGFYRLIADTGLA